MSQSYIQDYLAELNRLRRVSGLNKETIVREAFKDLLKRFARQNDLVFIAEYPMETGRKKRISVDGALLHSLRVPLGYYEAKDEGDDLDEEIEKKFRAGYPQDNIIFEDSREAVLIQNKEHVMRCAVDDVEGLAELLKHFFAYERPEIEDFRKAVEQFKKDLPAITDALNRLIETAGAENATYKKAEAKFLAHAKETINPAITLTDIREMLMQHILTEEIFAHVFNDGDFHRQNNVARELYALEDTFFKSEVKRNTLAVLEPYYATIRSNAALITSHAEKQKFLKTIYEEFYKVYNPKAADRLGVVYTPNEIVRFMIDGADWLCRHHFGKGLIDKGVEILDPATGTGTFVCELLQSFSGSPDKMHYKYKEEIHANEVAILPYYVANLNIEATFASISGQYAEYPNLCFVDTLDNIGGLRKFSGHQEEMFGAVSEVNVARIKRQNARKISVIIGNPPYNANQQNENDNNKNRTYAKIDERIKSTYIKESTAQKTKQYDMFVRFIRWASDRLNGDGILAFIVNRKFLDGRNFDGFRKIVERECDEFRIVDLGGDYKLKGVGGGGNVFGIGTGVAMFWAVVKGKSKAEGHKAKILYSVAEGVTGEEKLAWINRTHLDDLKPSHIQPDDKHSWLDLATEDMRDLIPVASKDAKAGKLGSKGKAIFELYSLGVSTNRDEWIYDFDEQLLVTKMAFFDSIIKDSKKRNVPIQNTIKLSRNLSRRFKTTKLEKLNNKYKINSALYRPFIIKNIYVSETYIDELGLQKLLNNFKSSVIYFSDRGHRSEFTTFSSDHVVDLHCGPSVDAFQCLPLYRYTSDGTRIENITDWALEQFRNAYPYQTDLTKLDIFHYVYAVLHDPLYREKYALNLKREFPRIPFYSDFSQWAAWGKRLMALHIGFETVEPWPLERVDTIDEKAKAAGLKPKVILKSKPELGVIELDSETQVRKIPSEVWTYKLGNRSALDWILDQYKEKTPKDPTIREKFNTYRFADYKEKVIELLLRVTRVSVETVAITDAMKVKKR